jgi:hypothetical protein
VASATLPTFEFVRLPNDHTSGTRVGAPTLKAMVADNDLALGKLVDAVSHSPYWSSTAIFVIEDDAQNGPDHVDAHRTIAQVISPYTQTGNVDSTFYSTVSMLRTMELVVGVHPLTQFDALAEPMRASFTSRPVLTPYTAITPSRASFAQQPTTGCPGCRPHIERRPTLDGRPDRPAAQARRELQTSTPDRPGFRRYPRPRLRCDRGRMLLRASRGSPPAGGVWLAGCALRSRRTRGCMCRRLWR